jgi:hypothetical protein
MEERKGQRWWLVVKLSLKLSETDDRLGELSLQKLTYAACKSPLSLSSQNHGMVQ